MHVNFTANVTASMSKNAVKQKTKNRGKITGDDIKNIIVKNCNLTNEVLELREELSQVYENHGNMVQKWYEKKIERIAIERELAEENERFNRLKDYVDIMNTPPPPTKIFGNCFM